MQALAEDGARLRRERLRQLPVPGVWAYVDRLDVRPGTSVKVHVNAPSAHSIDMVRLGLRAVIDPKQSLADDRADVQLLATVDRPATPQTIDPGSYIHIGGAPVPAGEVSMGLWVRLWKLPVIDVVQVAWHGLITDIDYPDAARFGLLIDHLGRVGVYAGDGGAFVHKCLHMSEPVFAGRLGRWVHVAAACESHAIRIFIDGREFARFDTPAPEARITSASRLRIGAMAETGEADDFLDGDIAAPFIGNFVLDEAAARRLFEDGGLHAPSDLGLGAALSYWPLDEEHGHHARDAGGQGRHGAIVNHGAWMVGGPRFDPANRKPGEYDPLTDEDHGHGLRLSSDDLMDARWPVAAEFPVSPDADSGLYAIRIRLSGQAPEHACVVPFVVSRRKPRRPNAIAVLCATNTWHAYGRRPTNELAVYGLTSTYYSAHYNGRPFFHLGLRLPLPYADPYRFESRRATRTQSTHLVRSERHLEAWLNREGYNYEVVTDSDLHADPALLKNFAALALVGHSEYWTDKARQGVVDYLDGGGKLLCLSGDTLTVRVTLDESGMVMECRKIVFADDPRWLGPSQWGESWHSEDKKPGGTNRRLGQPPYEILGISFKGMIDDGTASSFAPYTVLDPEHFLFKTPHVVPIPSDGKIGTHSLNGAGGASGYEFDANLDKTGLGRAPLPGVTTLASAIGQRNIEWLGEQNHGADLIYWRQPNGGTVINFGSIAAAGALPVDAAFAGLMRNALAHFGVAQTARASDGG